MHKHSEEYPGERAERERRLYVGPGVELLFHALLLLLAASYGLTLTFLREVPGPARAGSGNLPCVLHVCQPLSGGSHGKEESGGQAREEEIGQARSQDRVREHLPAQRRQGKVQVEEAGSVSVEAAMSVIEIYRTFQHRDPEGHYPVEVPYSTRAPREMALLGELSELHGQVEGYGYYSAWEPGSGALLLASAEGVLFVYDPDQGLESLPRLDVVTYRTDKGEGLQFYEHRFKPPVELVKVAGSCGCLARLRGAYRIESRGIV